ncbi:MAG: hypothetical protein NXI04_03120 [Planctomycetaceae bacterium]|nr:hypothetical protein [Planctomycetaceae bacterium]
MPTFRSRLKSLGFVALNAWLVFHVFAIFIAPAGMPPASPLLVDASRLARPYNDALFLYHGYHYFAPDPGASTLVSWRVDRPGALPVRGRFPDRAIWPRLRYHRYFMLADNLGGFPDQMQANVFTAYARYFAALHGSSTISLDLLRHHPSSIIRMQAGGQLSDEETFETEPLGEWDFTPPQDAPAAFDGLLAPPADETSADEPSAGQPSAGQPATAWRSAESPSEHSSPVALQPVAVEQ